MPLSCDHIQPVVVTLFRNTSFAWLRFTSTNMNISTRINHGAFYVFLYQSREVHVSLEPRKLCTPNCSCQSISIIHVVNIVIYNKVSTCIGAI